MDPNQQQLLLTGGAKDSTYIDDVFSTFLYTGSGTSTAYNNGIDLQGEGGMVWIKDRDSSNENVLFDTERGATKLLVSDDDYAEATSSDSLTSFNNNGFTVGNYANANASGPYASWTFRKAKGFFDVVTWTGNSSTTQTISHSLGSLPGCIMAKCTSHPANWAVYHRNLDNENQPASHYLRLNTTNAQIDDDNKFADTEPTATNFTAGNELNENTKTYVAYIFAGGDSDAATARSVEFDGSGDYLSLAASSDWEFTGEFCIEYWVNPYVTNQEFPTITWGDGAYRALFWNGSSAWRFQWPAGSSNVTMGGECHRGQWQHHALTRDSSNNLRFFINGTLIHTSTETGTLGDNATLYMGYKANVPSNELWGKLSNVRIVKGSAVYTSSFRPPTKPLTSITNTVLLCCNNSSTTGKTTGGTITANGNPTASTNSPFDDPNGFKFGDSGSENIIKCGSYTGDGASNANGGGFEVNLGWEPQYVLIKNVSAQEDWHILDVMRGLPHGESDKEIHANNSGAEQSFTDGGGNYLDMTPNGFTVNTGNGGVNGNGDTMIYMAIRRSEGYVGKPPEAGTEVFAMTAGRGGTSPNYQGGIVIDYQLTRDIDSSNNWYTGARLFGANYLKTNSTDVENPSGTWLYDYMDGYNTGSSGSDWQSWQWKRHAGFDVVTYRGNGIDGQQVGHSLGKDPEMIWIKSRGSITQWCIGHKGRNGGVNPWNYFSALNADGADEDNVIAFYDTAPTSTHFTVGSGETANANNFKYLTMLFASVDGISKVGYYTGTGSSGNEQTVGFTPRFVIIKRTDSTGSWLVLDTTRGWGSGDDKYIYLNSISPQADYDWGAPTSTGFTLNDHASANASGGKYIYYAHA